MREQLPFFSPRLKAIIIVKKKTKKIYTSLVYSLKVDGIYRSIVLIGLGEAPPCVGKADLLSFKTETVELRVDRG